MIQKKTLLFLILFSLIFLNLALLIFLRVSPLNSFCDIDSKAYIEKATILSERNSLAPEAHQGQLPYYTLGYPIIIGIIFKIFSSQIGWLILIQILLTLLSAFLIFVTARRLFNETVGTIAFALTCINVGFLTFSQFVLTESFLALFLILFFERFTAYLYNNKLQYLCSAGLFLGLSVIIKPAALYYPILLLPLIYYITPIDKKFRYATFFLAFFIVPILSYMLHNKVVFDQFKISNLDSVNIYFWFYPNVLAQEHGTSSDIERLRLQFIAGQDNYNIRAVKEMFKRDLIKKPILFVRVWLKNVTKTFLGLFTTNLKVLVEPNVKGGDISFFKTKGNLIQRAWFYIESGATSNWLKAVGWYEAIWTILRYIFCFFALLTIFYLRRYTLLYFINSYIFYFSIITGHDGCSRFRMMFEFVLIILTAFGIWLFFTKGKAQAKDKYESLCDTCGR
jgi:4-amino-4-deoxy-L-arabinose transferase-like glycosyltransferase